MNGKKQYEILIYLLSCMLQGRIPEEELLTGIDLEYLYQLATEHSVGAMVCAVLEKTSVFYADSRKTDEKEDVVSERNTDAVSAGDVHRERDVSALRKKWLEIKQNALRKAILMDSEREILQDALNQAGIWHVFLKGAVLADWYPVYGIREMADQDILYDSSRQEDMMNIMLGLGYTAESIGKSHHDVYYKPPIYNFEMHTALFGKGHDPVWVDYYRDIRNRLIPVKAYTFAMSWEDLYIHVIAHGYKHYRSAGTGLRTLTDQYVFLQRYESALDWKYIVRELNTLGIEEYERTTRSLVKKLFSGNLIYLKTETLADRKGWGRKHGSSSGDDKSSRLITEKKDIPGTLSQEETEYLYYILNSGVYGSMEHFVENQLKKIDTGDKSVTWRKLRYLIKRIFPGREYFHDVYPIFEKYAILRPFFWIYRIGRAIGSGMGRLLYELKILIDIQI